MLIHLLIAAQLKAFQQPLQHNRSRNLPVGGFGDDNALRAFYHIVRNNHVAADGQAMHEVGVVSHGHLTVVPADMLSAGHAYKDLQTV